MISKTKHMEAVRQMPCVVTKRSPVTLHHCHGGSLTEEFPRLGRGGAQRTSDYLVIPITADIHVGHMGIDGSLGVRAWEEIFGRQTDLLRKVSEHLGYDVFELAEKTRCLK